MLIPTGCAETKEAIPPTATAQTSSASPPLVSDQLISMSNFGVATTDIAAPGEWILSIGGIWSGTSFAAPFVTGAASIYMGMYPQATPEQVKNAIMISAKRVPAIDGKTGSGGTPRRP